ncbi:MAG: YncE family protein [Acidobacteriota bacterium]
MKFYRTALPILFCFILTGSGLAQTSPTAAKYSLDRKIALTGDGSWDYPALDLINRRLYVSHETEVEVIDIDSGEFVGRISDTPGVHGTAPLPEFGKIFVSEGKADAVGIFDIKTLSPLGTIKTGKGPDAIIYDSATRRLFTSNGDSADTTAINADTGKVDDTIPLGGDPESLAVDGKGHLFVNIADKNEVVKLDTKKLAVEKRWAISGCQEPKSLALDNNHHRLFVGCRNKVMAVVNSQNGRVITTLPIGERVDATIFDSETGMIFNSNGDGTITIVHEDAPNKYRVVEIVTTQRGAKTMAFDPKTKRLFLPVADLKAAADNSTVQKPVAGTFVVLVFARK